MSRVSATIALAFVTLFSAGVTTRQLTSEPPRPLTSLPGDTPIRGLYLEATPTTSVGAATRGKAFSVLVDVTPRKGIHVYAPGNRDYLPVALTVDAQPGLVVGTVEYPKAQVLYFAPLKERVQVYSEGFRLGRAVTIAIVGAGAAQTMTVKGKLEYQACDDKVCYLPQSLPLTWTLSIKR